MSSGTRAAVFVRGIESLDDTLEQARRDRATIGLVPTLGALHRGHASLIEAARRDNDVVVVSIFLNPTQFNDPTDLERYPADPDADRELAVRAGADVVFSPDFATMYPAGAPEVTVDPGWAGTVLEGESRPGHFRGVATVVAKLFSIVKATRAYFGEKDYQQLVIVRRLVDDLSIPTEVVGCPTMRERDGLAISSRNALLLERERRAAAVLHRALVAGADAVAAGVRAVNEVEKVMRGVVSSEPLVELEYAVAVREASLEPVGDVAPGTRLLIAARIGRIRLIDNVLVVA